MKSFLNVYKALSICILLITIVGCSHNDNQSTLDIGESAFPEATTIPDAWESLAQQTGKVDDGWLKSFNDKQLEDLVSEALSSNLNLRTIAANVDVAAAIAVQAGASLKPIIGLGGGAEKTYGGSVLDTNSWAAIITWELDVWGKLRARSDAAEESLKATIADFEAARLSLVGQVTKSWILASEIEQQKKLTLENIDIFKGILEYASNRNRIGKVTSQDVHIAAADLANAEAMLRTIESSEAQIIRSLELLLGRYPAGELKTRSDFIPIPESIPSGIPSELLERRFDIIAAEHRVASAFKKTEEAEAAKLPSFSLTAAGGQASNQLINLLGVGKDFFSVGVNFIAPLYSGGALEAEVDIQTANQEIALAAYGQTALTAFSEVENGLDNERLLAEREVFLAEALSENERALLVAKKQNEIGMIDLFTVLQIQARVNSSKSEIISIKSERIVQRVNLHMALGGSFAQ